MKGKPRETKSGGFGQSPKPSSRDIKSAGNSPVCSPTLNRKVVNSRNSTNKKTNSTVGASLNNTVIIDPSSIDEPLEKTTVIPPTPESITQCPCGMFDRKCIAIKCSKCSGDWHTECCNLTGVTPSVARKLESQLWKCPWCYQPDIQKPDLQSEIREKDAYDKFTCSISRLQTFTEELNDNITSVEFFNQHIKHLLLDDTKFKQHTEQLERLSADVVIIKEKIPNLSEVSKRDICELNETFKDNSSTISEKINRLQHEIINLSQTPKCECLELITTISDQLANIPKEETSTNLQNEHLSNMQKDITVMSKTMSSMKMETSNTDNVSDIATFKEQLAELLARPTSSTSSEGSSFPLDKLDSISERLDKLSSEVSAIKINSADTNYLSSTSELTSVSPSARPRPNTQSPRLTEMPVHDCDPFTSYSDSVIPEDLKGALNRLVDSKKDSFTTIGTDNSRDVLYFGEYSYRYSGGQHPAQQIPEEIDNLIDCVRAHLPNPDMKINSCLISRYLTGDNSIPPHRDNEAAIDPESHIITASIGAERTMTFSSNSGHDVRHQTLGDGSVLVSSRFSQDFWVHSIDPSESTGIRYSFTLRHVDPHFINSTVILGDSNTQHLKFGTGIGTLGAWMPGKRIKAGHIDAIPKASEIGPYRNIIIHTGINSINCSFKYKQSNQALINNLEAKVRNITETYPNTKVHISLLLPSRSPNINHRINGFNNLILDMTCRLSRVAIIEHSMFGDSLSNEHGRWKRSEGSGNDFIPNFDDILHLGKVGLRLFATNLKQAVVTKNRSQSAARFNGSRGGYRRAFGHGRPNRGGSSPS